MKLLVVSARPPWPPTMADAMTVDRLVRFLAGRGHTVDLTCFVETAGDERALREGLGTVCRRIEVVRLPAWVSYASTALTLPFRRPMQTEYYRSRGMHERIARMVAGERYDLVYTHLIRMAEYTRHLPLPKVMGMQVCQALNLGRMLEHADPARKLFYGIEAAKVRPYEVAAAADFDRVFLCGPSDIAALERTAPVPNAVVCPHGQDVPPVERVRSSVRVPGAVVISGVMSTFTNVDAVTWFAEEIFPRVLSQVPHAVFWIVGRNPQRAVSALAQPDRVEVTGEVPDVADWLCRAEVGVAPLRIAAGMQNKLVQAMACELAVVATSAANEGIGATPDAHLLVRDDAAGFADAVVRLLRDSAMRSALGRAARSFVEAHWTWEAHFEKLEKVLSQVADRGGRAAAR
jgi:glycosyltransferase involved in cell wall biosynthesis